MKIRKILAVLLIIVMCFTFVACDTSSQGTKNEVEKEPQKDVIKSGAATPLLYKVTDDEGNVAWLFGSIHVGEKYFYPLPDYVLNALDNADSLAVEFDIVEFGKDQAAAMEMITKFVLTDGSTIADLVPNDVYEEAKEILKDNGYYISAMDYYMPILWSDFIDEFLYEEIDVKTDLGVDEHLINRAYDKGIEVLDVESAEFQFGMMVGFSKELQALLLAESIEAYKNPEESREEIDEMLRIWAKGNEKEFAKFLSEEDVEFETKGEQKLYEEYNNAMMVSRNAYMADWAEDVLKSGKEVFICVGAAHVVGDGAMVETLRERGYKVEIVR